MKIESGNFCPLVKKDCIGLACKFMVQLRGSNPNTGAEVDEWDCAIKWLPILLIENAKEVRQGAAATESFRNEMVNASKKTVETMVALSNSSNEIPMRLVHEPNNH
ncbi:MAG: hypothetical protein JW395_1582 [Nitrospira sp.]|nr:hypothetical protein [Nitrospira sp.]